jgi:hypothetical protein
MLRAMTKREEGNVYLRAFCFERGEPRTFRLDRVARIIDGDGVVHDDPGAFFRDELRIEVGQPSLPPAEPAPTTDRRAPPAVPVEKPGQAQRRAARDGLRVLVALARSDGLLHSAEAEVVLDYIGAVCAAAAVPCATDDRNALAAYVRRQRPGSDVLDECLARLETAPPSAQALLLAHAERLILADGHRHEAEEEVLAGIRESIAPA